MIINPVMNSSSSSQSSPPMASFILFVGLIGFLIRQAHSLTCSSKSFKNRSFAHCDDLSHLSAFLHWTHHPENSSLSVAFTARLPHANGWIAWAVNPTSKGMAGAQALIATLSVDSPNVRTFNISSYSSVVPSLALSFPVWDLAAEFSQGRLTIFATVKVPPKAKSLNQVWQVGPAIHTGSCSPGTHAFKPENLNAKGVLVFDKKSGGASPLPLAHGGATSPPSAAAVGVNKTAIAASVSGSDKAGVARIKSGNFGLTVGLFVFISCGIV